MTETSGKKYFNLFFSSIISYVLIQLFLLIRLDNGPLLWVLHITTNLIFGVLIFALIKILTQFTEDKLIVGGFAAWMFLVTFRTLAELYMMIHPSVSFSVPNFINYFGFLFLVVKLFVILRIFRLKKGIVGTIFRIFAFTLIAQFVINVMIPIVVSSMGQEIANENGYVVFVFRIVPMMIEVQGWIVLTLLLHFYIYRKSKAAISSVQQ